MVRTFGERLQLWQRQLLVRLLGIRAMVTLLGQRLLPEPEQTELRRTLIERWAENNKQAYLNSLRAIVGWSVAGRLNAIQCPTLVVAAEHDYTPLDIKQACVDRIPHAKLAVIADSRHMTPVDQPERFNRVLVDFLEKQS